VPANGRVLQNKNSKSRTDEYSDPIAMRSGSVLLRPADPAPFEILNADAASTALLVCDHASRAIPAALDNLGLPEAALDRHIACDIGAAELTRSLACILDAPAVLAGFSRLVVDCNRALDDPTAFLAVSDGDIVPGNRDLDGAAKALREHEIYWPYHQAIEAQLDEYRLSGRTPALIAVHSFTPFFDSRARPWEIGVLWDKDPRIPVPLICGLRDSGVVVGDNQPYSGKHPADFTIDHHGEEAGLPCVSIEIRQDLVRSPEGVAQWSRLLGKVLADILANDGLYRPRQRENLI